MPSFGLKKYSTRVEYRIILFVKANFSVLLESYSRPNGFGETFRYRFRLSTGKYVTVSIVYGTASTHLAGILIVVRKWPTDSQRPQVDWVSQQCLPIADLFPRDPSLVQHVTRPTYIETPSWVRLFLQGPQMSRISFTLRPSNAAIV